MSFFMLAKSCSGLWIVKAEPKSLAALLVVVKNIGMSITLMWLSIVASHQSTKRLICVQPNGVRGLNLKNLCALA
jgi:hypothetical protein